LRTIKTAGEITPSKNQKNMNQALVISDHHSILMTVCNIV
jgi:hypothetical protein